MFPAPTGRCRVAIRPYRRDAPPATGRRRDYTPARAPHPRSAAPADELVPCCLHVALESVCVEPRGGHQDQPVHADCRVLLARRGIHRRAAAGRDADLEVSAAGRPGRARSRVAEAGDGLTRGIEVERKAVPAVALLDGAMERSRGAAPDHDRRVWALYWMRIR